MTPDANRHPSIDGKLCVHGRCATASCQACVEACPRHAFAMTEAALTFDADACDGCGLCRPACPEAAVTFSEVDFGAYLDQDNAQALIACELSDVEPGPGVVPCLHGLGHRDLLEIAARASGVVTARGDCASCPRATVKSIDLALAEFNLRRISTRQPPLNVAAVTAANWTQRRSAASARGNDIDQGRRRLFGIKNGRTGPPDAERDAVASTSGAVYRFVPVIDQSRCTGCDACTRVCSHEAVAILSDAQGQAYRIDAANCTGCRLCADVCEPKAIDVKPMQPAAQTRLPLAPARCSKCGAPFHQPSSSGSRASAVCWICQRKNHAGLLFQVRK